MQISKHADARARQRGIPRDYVNLILKHGTMKKKPGKAFEIQIRTKDKNRIIQDIKKLINAVERCSKKAVLIDSKMETVITLYNH